MNVKCIFAALSIVWLLNGCADPSEKCNVRRVESTVLRAPFSQINISNLVVVGMSVDELFLQCGEPSFVIKTNGLEYLMYRLSFEGTEVEYSEEWEISNILVLVSNRCVVAWRPSGKRTVRKGASRQGKPDGSKRGSADES